MSFPVPLNNRFATGANHLFDQKKGAIMGKADSYFLDVNDVFPDLNLEFINGETISVPRELGGGYGIMLIYRGYW